MSRAAQLAGHAARVAWPLPLLLVLVVAATEIAFSSGGSVTRGVVIVALINLTLVVGLYVFVGNSGVFSFGSIAFAFAAVIVMLLFRPQGLIVSRSVVTRV